MAKRTSRTRKLLLMATLGFLLYPSVGCTMATGLGSKLAHNDALDDFMVSYRNQAWAAKAWHCRKHRHGHHRFSSDLENGFRAGYQAVAEGGNGCVPAVCPQSYWGWQYQTADGQARMGAWFEGYPLGVQAAEQDGIGHWSQVRTSLAYPPPMNMAGSAAAGSDLNAMPVTGTFSDTAEIIPTPEPISVFEAHMQRTRAASTSAENAGSMPAKAADVTASELTPAKRAAAPRVETTPATPKPAAKAVPVVPQPRTDPFSFN